MFNARSILNKLGDFKLFIDSNDPDIVVLTESWLNSSVPSSLLVSCQTYDIFRKDRCSRGGGVCVLVKKHSRLTTKQVSVPPEHHDLEIIVVDLSDSDSILPFRLVVVYRPPSYDSADTALLFSALDSLATGCVRLCVLGDFNLPDFDWDMFTYPQNSLYATAADFVCNHGLTQLVNDPTRGDAVLDLILCSDVLCCDDVCTLPPLGSSDHCMVSFTLFVSLSQAPAQVANNAKPNFSRADWPGICNFLSFVNWQMVFANCVSANDYWNSFILVIGQAIDKFVPCYVHTKHTVSVKSYPLNVRKLRAKKLRCWKLYRQFKTDELYRKYKDASSSCTRAINNHIENIEKSLISDGRIGSFYKYVNKKLNGSNGIAPLKVNGGPLIQSDGDKATLLNDYFSSVFTQDNGVIDTERLPAQINSAMSCVFFTPSMVLKLIKQLKRTGSAGPDHIPAEFYKATGNLICFPLSVIFNISIQKGELPDLWKCAAITPVFKKKGSPSDFTNYRPISLTCIACKLLESGIKDCLLHHLLQHNIINSHQHGFLSRKSTTTQLLECTLDWNIALNAHCPMDVVYLDYAKAFDSVVHNKLIAKLDRYGINVVLLQWIANFLNGRCQYVRIGNSCSSVSSVISGVPQGSVLGPVLFILYTNDICELIPDGVTAKLFADDTKLYSVFSGSITPGCLQSCLASIADWSDHWQLALSPTKCSILHVSSGTKLNANTNHTYHLGSTTLPTVDSITDLGVTYDNRLSFSLHINKIVTKASLRAKLILNCFQSRDPHVLIKAFCTFVRPILEYCCIIWNPRHKYEIDKIEAVQRRFTKRIRGFYNMSYTNRLRLLHLDSLACRRITADLVMCYKILNNHVCLDSGKFFTGSTVGRTRGNTMKLMKVHTLSARDGHFFSNRVVNVWNSLSDSVILSPTVTSFKHKLHTLDLSCI